MNWYLKAFSNYATFSGRAQRSEYWFFMLFYMLIVILAAFIDGVIGSFNQEVGLGFISGIVVLVHFIPSLSVSIRRLHDIGKSGWWYLLILIPLIGPLVLFIFAVLDSTLDNEYGVNPKAV